MTLYADEPRTAAEAIERARAVVARRRLADEPPPPDPQWKIDGPSISAQMRAAIANLDDLTGLRRTVPEIVRAIVASVALESGIPAEEIVGRSQSQATVRARWQAIARVREHTDASTPQIGRWFGRDHSSVLYALRMSTKLESRSPGNYQRKLTREQAEEIARDPRAPGDIADSYGVSRRQVIRIKTGEVWA